MHVKGIAYLARESMMMAAHGADTWRSFMADFSRTEPIFKGQILPITRIPAEAFLRLNDALVQRFYKGDPQAYWAYGEQSAQFAMTQGQLKGLFQPGEFQKFLMSTPAIWKGYFDAGELAAIPSGPGTIDIRIFDVPIKHVYFEYSVVGFGKGGMKVPKAPHPDPQLIRGFSKGDDDVLYRFRIT